MTIRRTSLVAISLLAAAAVAASSASGAVPGTSAWRVKGARDLGALGARRMTLTFALTPRHAAALRARASLRQAAMTPSQFNSRFAPSARTVKSLRRWGTAHRLRVISVSRDRMLVPLAGSSTAFGRALHTSFDSFSSPATGTFFQITRPARLPKAFADKVTAVLGLSNLPKLSPPRPAQRSAAGLSKVLASLPALGLSAASLSYPAAYGPKDFWSMYDAPASQTGSGQQLAIIAEGNVSQPKKDLTTFEQKYGLPTVTWNQINVGTPSSDTSGDDEWDLDSQYSTGFAPGVSQLTCTSERR